MKSPYVYDGAFQDYTAAVSYNSAQILTGLLQSFMKVESVLDVGCSSGTWLAAWHSRGVEDFLGLDGEYVDQGRLLIPRDRFRPHDLNQPFRLGRTFDLVECLEVAEHLPAGRARDFVADLTSHGAAVLFSAAPPGQGGQNHINEQPYAYWRDLFAERGYVLLDFIRPALSCAEGVPPWYRQNAFLFVAEEQLTRLPAFLGYFRRNGNDPIPDVSSPGYRLRKMVLRCLPFPVLQFLSKLAARTG